MASDIHLALPIRYVAVARAVITARMMGDSTSNDAVASIMITVK